MQGRGLCIVLAFHPLLRWMGRILLMQGFALIVALIATAAAAQDSGPRSVITVRGDVIGAASDGPIATSSFSQAALSNAGAEDLASLGRLVPGLSVSVGAATGVPVFTIRGAGLNDITSNAESTVSLAQDGVAFPYAVMMRGLLFDLDRAEISKGPQGDRGGRSATGGRINLISAAPTSDFAGALDWSADQFGVQDIQASVSNGLGGGFSGRFSGRLIWSEEGYQKSISRPEDRLGARDQWALRGSLAYERGPLKGVLRLHWDEDRSENLAPMAYDGRRGGFDQAQPLPTPYDARDYFTGGGNRYGDWGADFRPQRRKGSHLNFGRRGQTSASNP